MNTLEAGQPTNGELELGMCAVKCGTITLEQFKELRARRSMWYGAESNELLHRVNRFIREIERVSRRNP